MSGRRYSSGTHAGHLSRSIRSAGFFFFFLAQATFVHAAAIRSPTRTSTFPLRSRQRKRQQFSVPFTLRTVYFKLYTRNINVTFEAELIL